MTAEQYQNSRSIVSVTTCRKTKPDNEFITLHKQQSELIMIQMQEKQENELVKSETRMRKIIPNAQAREQGLDDSTSTAGLIH